MALVGRTCMFQTGPLTFLPNYSWTGPLTYTTSNKAARQSGATAPLHATALIPQSDSACCRAGRADHLCDAAVGDGF